MQELDDQLDAAESRSEELNTKFEESEKTLDEYEQARKILANRARNDSAKIENLEKELKDHNEKIANHDSCYEEYSQES